MFTQSNLNLIQYRYGNYRSSVRTHSSSLPCSAWQREAVQPSSAERHAVCRRAGVQAASGAIVWGFLGPGSAHCQGPGFGNGSYQVRSADALERSTTNDFREDLVGIEPGTYQTEGSIAGTSCYYVILQVAGAYPSWMAAHNQQEFWARGPATVTLPALNDYGYPRAGFYSKGCKPWKRVEAGEAS